MRQAKVHKVLILQCKREGPTYRSSDLSKYASKARDLKKGFQVISFDLRLICICGLKIGNVKYAVGHLKASPRDWRSGASSYPHAIPDSRRTATLNSLTDSVASHSAPDERLIVLQPELGPVVCQLVVAPIAHPCELVVPCSTCTPASAL